MYSLCCFSFLPSRQDCRSVQKQSLHEVRHDIRDSARSVEHRFFEAARAIPIRPERWMKIIFAEQAHLHVRKTYMAEMAVIVSDLSGFTSTTRKWGIIHFAGIIARKRHMCLPIVKRRGGVHVQTEGDNLMVAFCRVEEAVKAALEMRRAIQLYNDALGEDMQHFRIRLNGIGVDCATGLQIDKHGDMVGAAFQGAYRIGEDLCKDGKVLISARVKARVEKDAFFKDARFEPFDIPDDDCQQALFEVAGDPGPLLVRNVSPDDGSQVPSGLLPLCRRYALEKQALKDLDASISRRYMLTRSVLMFRHDIGDGSAHMADILREKALLWDLVLPLMQEHRGQGLELMLWVFQSPVDAVLAALEVRRKLAKQVPPLKVTGYGIHHGPLLLIDGTDIHWGDPVNTASKLGQDLATDRDILITEVALEALRSCDGLQFQPRVLERSGVSFTCYCVQDD